jgi:signal transduction histidine kinase
VKTRLTIRTKLIAAIALVLGISSVLTASTLVGLYSYRNTIKTFGSKMEELPLVADLFAAVTALERPDGTDAIQSAASAAAELSSRIAGAQEALDRYRHRLRATAQQGRDPDRGRAEIRLLDEIDEHLAALRALPPLPYWTDDEGLLMLHYWGDDAVENRRRFHHELATLAQIVSELPRHTFHDMSSRIDDSRRSYRSTLAIAWGAGVLVVGMLLLLARLFYQWVFQPIRRLHDSVQAVGAGVLSHRIRLDTGDEMQQLAEAFNEMTAKLQQICQNLEQEVDQRSRQLVRSERLASVGFLAAGVAHEINNPLASITLSSESLERRLRKLVPRDAADAQDVWRCLSMIQSESFRCKGITEKLLDFSRMRELERQATPLAHLVADVIDVLQHMGRYREKNIVLQAQSEVTAEVNPQELKQVVLNLAVNALDSMDSGGTLEIDIRSCGAEVELIFSDDGCGMTADVLNNIFEPFFTRSRTGRGTGLGLSITHRIVTEHGGQITAHSDGPFRGSCFTVRLPLRAKTGTREGGACEPIAA